jgi:hypothetical protein
MTLEWKMSAPGWHRLVIGDFELTAGTLGQWSITMNGEDVGVYGQEYNLISAKLEAVYALRERAIAVLEALGQWSP